jgi:hypothetical protein
MRRIERSRTMFAVWLPDPLTVAIWMLKSFTTRCVLEAACCSWTARSVGDIRKSLMRMKIGNPGGSSPRKEIRESISRSLSAAEPAIQLLTGAAARGDAPHAAIE